MVKVYTCPNDIADNVERWVTGTKIPWFYFNHTLGADPKGEHRVEQSKYTIADMPRLTHYFFPNSKTPNEDIRSVQPLTDWLRRDIVPGYKIARVMGNLTTRMVDAELMLNLPHKDSEDPKNFTFLYYVNNSDGKTVFFKDGKIDCEIDPIKGTGALFPGNTVHAGQLPYLNKTRYVINIILTPERV